MKGPSETFSFYHVPVFKSKFGEYFENLWLALIILIFININSKVFDGFNILVSYEVPVEITQWSLKETY